MHESFFDRTKHLFQLPRKSLGSLFSEQEREEASVFDEANQPNQVRRIYKKGRLGSEAPSSSSSDFYATNSPEQLATGTKAVGDPAVDHPGQAYASDGPHEDDDQDDDASVDMVLSDSRSPTPDHHPRPQPTESREPSPLPLRVDRLFSQSKNIAIVPA